MNENHVYDMIIVGGGPGGYTSALYAARAGFDTIVLEKLSAGGQMSLTWQIDNYPGFENGIDGFSLAEKMQKQAEKFGAKSEYAEVFNMDLTGKLKRVETSSGIYIGKTVVIATGANPRKLGLAKEKELIGHGVAYCASCDGMFYKDKIVVVVGGGNSAVSDAFNKNVLATNPAKGINLPKKIKKTEYRVLKIDEKKTLTLPQVLRLIEASKETPIHMQILFAVLMGLRRSEINGLKYSDVDYIHRMLRVERQLGKKPNSKAEDCAPKMLTKQEIKTKTPAGVRELPIPDYVFEAILEERKTYEKNRRRRPKEFRDWNYICCSTYGNPRSKGFHQKYYKDLLKSLDLPDIHFHQLRNTYATILLKNSFNSKGVSHLLGHAKEIISVDVYGDTQEIIEDCLDILEPFIEEVIPKERKDQYYDYSEVIEIDLILEEYFNAA